MPVSLLPGLTRALAVSIEALVGEDKEADTLTVSPRRSKRGLPSKLERQLDAINQLPKAEQRFVSKMLDNLLAQHQGQENANTA